MAIKFKCPKCSSELNVKDELAGKQGKCPSCKTILTVPSPAGTRSTRPTATASATPPRKPAADDVIEAEVVEEEDVVDAEVVDDDGVVEAQVIDDEPPAKKPRGGKRDTAPDDFNFTRPAADEEPEERVSTSRRSSRRRDEDDDEDDEPRSKRRTRRDEDDEEDDRPSRRKKASSRRRDDDDDDDYDDDDDDGGSDRRKKAKERKRRQGWKKASTGLLLNFLSMCFCTGAWGILFLISLITVFLMITKTGGMGIFGFFEILGYLAEGLMVIGWILCIIGGAFLLLSPGKHGEMGLGIAVLTLGSVVLCFYLYLKFSFQFGLASAFGFSMGGGGLRGIGIVIYFFPMVELARLCLLGLYQWATARSVKDESLTSSSLMLAITVPSAAFAMVLITYLIGSLLVSGAKSTAPIYIMAFFMLFELGAWTALLAWMTLNTSMTKNAADYAR